MPDDITIANEAPAVVYEGTESLAVYQEDREIDGVMYRTSNAMFDPSENAWYRVGADDAIAFATAQNLDGSIGHLSKTPVDTVTPFYSWDGNGQRGVFNVRDFGAVGDGTTDDTDAINRAALAAMSNGGGVVYCPSGRYLISYAIKLYCNTTLQGDGPESSVLLAHAMMNGGLHEGDQGLYLDIAMIVNSNYTLDGPWQNDIFIKDLGLFGNGPGNRPPAALKANINNGLITLKRVVNQGVYRCSVQSSSNHGVDIFGVGPVGWDSAPIGNFYIVDCTIDLFPNEERPPGLDVSGFPIRGEGLDQGVSRGNVIGFGNIYDGLPQRTNDAMDFPGCSGMVVTNNRVTNCADGIGTNGAKDVVITDNVVINCDGYGIASFAHSGAGSAKLIISRNTIDNPRSAAIWLAPPPSLDESQPPTTAVISNNTITSGGAGAAIILAASYVCCHDNMVDLLGSGSEGIHCNADNLLVDGNGVFNGGAGSGGVVIKANAANLKLTNNYLADTAFPMRYAGGDLSTVSESVIRNNVGVNPSEGVLLPPALEINMDISNPFPLDCSVFIHGGTGISVKLQGTDTGLAGGAFFVPIKGTIRVDVTGSAPSWVWVHN